MARVACAHVCWRLGHGHRLALRHRHRPWGAPAAGRASSRGGAPAGPRRRAREALADAYYDLQPKTEPHYDPLKHKFHSAIMSTQEFKVMMPTTTRHFFRSPIQAERWWSYLNYNKRFSEDNYFMVCIPLSNSGLLHHEHPAATFVPHRAPPSPRVPSQFPRPRRHARSACGGVLRLATEDGGALRLLATRSWAPKKSRSRRRAYSSRYRRTTTRQISSERLSRREGGGRI